MKRKTRYVRSTKPGKGQVAECEMCHCIVDDVDSALHDYWLYCPKCGREISVFVTEAFLLSEREKYIRPCEYCNKEFFSVAKKQRFCSWRCAGIANAPKSFLTRIENVKLKDKQQLHKNKHLWLVNNTIKKGG